MPASEYPDDFFKGFPRRPGRIGNPVSEGYHGKYFLTFRDAGSGPESFGIPYSHDKGICPEFSRLEKHE